MAWRLGAWTAFIDETGLMLAPLLRSTWARRGVRPRILQVMGQRKKVSVIAALCISPNRRRLRLYVMLWPEQNIDGELTQFFLEHLLAQLPGPLVFLWDRLGAHLHEDVQDFIEDQSRLHQFFFPPYCPELNPDEQVWGWLKWDHLANFAPENLEALLAKAEGLIVDLSVDQDLLRTLMKRSELPFRLHGQVRH
jgi:transposase